MAELINKKDAIEQIKSIPYATQEEVFFMSAAVSRMRKIPTTTEAEIRASAISDTIEAVKEHTRIVGSTTCEDLDEIAEELKGGAD